MAPNSLCLKKTPLQVSDDFELLELMLDDMENAPDLYKPTNYWSIFINNYVPKLRQNGLTDYRRSKDAAIGRFIKPDPIPPSAKIILSQNRWLYNRYTIKIPRWSRLLEAISEYLTNKLFIQLGYAISPENLWQLSIAYVKQMASHTNACPLEDVQPSLFGNPEAVFEHNGIMYPFSFLTYYARYVYCTQFVNFKDIHRVVELGSGGGQQAEVLKKCHPDLTILLFDIPPQSYVCEQYLKASFPGQVRSYRSTREILSLDELEEGKIHILSASQMPLLKSYNHDLFISCVSLAEMEPHVVRNYLDIVNHSARNAYLCQYFYGKATARKKGLPGVLKPSVFKDYEASLNQLTLIDRSPVNTNLGIARGEKVTEEAFWRRPP